MVEETEEKEELEGEIEEKTTEETTEEPTEASEKKEEEYCDPLTMTCDEMRDEVIDLSNKRAALNTAIAKLDEIKEIIPGKEVEDAHGKATTERQKIDKRINTVFERFTVCTTKPQPELKEKVEEEGKRNE